MRVLIFSFTGLVAIVVAAAIWWTGRDLDAERANIEARRIESVSKVGIRRMLSENGSFKIIDVALGRRLDDGSRDFRGFLERDGNALPAYGRVRSVCEAGSEKPECWEIAYLEAKGKEVDTVGKLPLPAPQSDTRGKNSEQTSAQSPNATSDSPAGIGEDTASLTASPDPRPVTDPAPTAAVKEPEVTAKLEPDTASAGAGPLPTHTVVPSRVNARQGPGLDQPVLTVLSKGTELAIISERNGWGDFLVIQGENEGTRAWIALSIVAEIEPQ